MKNDVKLDMNLKYTLISHNIKTSDRQRQRITLIILLQSNALKGNLE